MGNLGNKLLFIGGIIGSIGIGNLKAQDTIYNLDGSIDKVVTRDTIGVLFDDQGPYLLEGVLNIRINTFKENKQISFESFFYEDTNNKLSHYGKADYDSIGRMIIKQDNDGNGHFNLIFREDNEKCLSDLDLDADGIYEKIYPKSNYSKNYTADHDHYPIETQKQILLDFKNFIKEKGRQSTGLYGKPIYSYKTNNVAEKKVKFSATLEALNIKNIETFVVSKENNPNDSLKTFSTKHTFIDYGTNGLKTKEDEYNWVDNRVKPKEDSRFLEFTSLPKERQTHATFTYFDLLVEIMKDAKWGEYK